jgi:hypothetical protein
MAALRKTFAGVFGSGQLFLRIPFARISDAGIPVERRKRSVAIYSGRVDLQILQNSSMS